jgi:hypothetical protein
MIKKTENKKLNNGNASPTLHNKNLDTMKLLTSWDKFQVDVGKIREDFSIPLEGFSSGEEAKNWDKNLCQSSDDFWETKYYRDKRKELLLLKEKDYRQFIIEQKFVNDEVPINKFNQSIESLVIKYHLPYNFLSTIRIYVCYGKITSMFLPATNFSLSFDPSGRKGTAKWVEIKTYAQLTEKEIRDAVKFLRHMQKHYLPPTLTKDVRIHQDIDRAIKIEKEMKQRIKKIVEKPDWYLGLVKKQHGEKKFEEVKKNNLWRVEKELVKYTSKEISNKFFGTPKKADLVRQIYSRLQKERKKRFGEMA